MVTAKGFKLTFSFLDIICFLIKIIFQLSINQHWILYNFLQVCFVRGKKSEKDQWTAHYCYFLNLPHLKKTSKVSHCSNWIFTLIFFLKHYNLQDIHEIQHSLQCVNKSLQTILLSSFTLMFSFVCF